MVALPLRAPVKRPPNLARIFLNTTASAILNFRSVKKSDSPFPDSSRLFLADSILGDRIYLIQPQTYLSMLSLLSSARVVFTDSGGIQEETTALGVPCLTLRPNTERPITVTEGTNTVVGVDPDTIFAAFNDVIETGGKAGRVPALWDGKASERICFSDHHATHVLSQSEG